MNNFLNVVLPAISGVVVAYLGFKNVNTTESSKLLDKLQNILDERDSYAKQYNEISLQLTESNRIREQQSKTIEDLKQQIDRQSKIIDQLTLQVEVLQNKIENLTKGVEENEAKA